MRIGIYGGSFNPVHFGHLGLATYVLGHTDLDEVWMLVSPNNPLKDSDILADEHVRLAALREAIERATLNGEATKRAALNAEGTKQPKAIIASDFEFSLPRPSYTANTLRELSRTYPEHEFSLIMGEDNWRIFDRWRESDFILSHYRIIVYPRHSSSLPEKTPLCGACDTSCADQASDLSSGASLPSSANVLFLHGAPYFDISSTELRNASRTPIK